MVSRAWTKGARRLARALPRMLRMGLGVWLATRAVDSRSQRRRPGLSDRARDRYGPGESGHVFTTRPTDQHRNGGRRDIDLEAFLCRHLELQDRPVLEPHSRLTRTPRAFFPGVGKAGAIRGA